MKKTSLHSFVFTFSFSVCLALSTQVSAKNLFNTVEPMNLDGKINVIVETPAGSTKLKKMDTKTGSITQAETVNYLAVPFNIGVVPVATYKGAPLQVILLSDAINTGSVQKAYAIGTLNYVQQGVDNKMVIAVSENSPFRNVVDLESLNAKFPGSLEIIQNWYANAHSDKQVSVTAAKSRLDAVYLVGDSILEFANTNIKESDRRPMDKDGNPTLLNHPASKNIRK